MPFHLKSNLEFPDTTTQATKGLLPASNLSDVSNAGTARTNLGLGGAAVLNVGTGAGTVAAGDDSRFAAGPSFATVVKWGVI